MTVSLPLGWIKTTMGEIAGPRRDMVAARSEGGRYLSLEHVEARTTKILGSSDGTNIKGTGVKFQSGDTLYARLRPYLNKVCIPDFGGVASGEFIVLPAVDWLAPKFLMYFLNQPDVVAFANARSTGTHRPRIKWDDLSTYPVLLPPLAEQRRIVAAIEEQFSRIDAGVVALQRAHGNLQRMRAAVLQAAVTGRLVSQNSGDEPAEILLSRILDRQRSVLVPKHQADRVAGPPATGPLPKGWTWVRLDQVAITSSGGTPRRDRPEYYGGAIPWVKSGELRDGYVRAVAECLTEEGLANSAAKLLPRGTLLIALYGATVGKLGILDIDQATTNQAVCAIRPILPEMRNYLWWVLRRYRADLISQGRGGAQANISQEILRKLAFALPPLPEQQRIVQKAEQYWSVLDAIERAIEVAVLRSDRLHRAILSVAFRGRLVDQDPSDEPAEVLLDRIKAARAVRVPTAGPGRRSPL